MRTEPTRLRAAVGLVVGTLAMAVLAAACSGDDPTRAQPTGTPTVTSGPKQTASKSPSKPAKKEPKAKPKPKSPPRSPLTGRVVKGKPRRVLIVKVDNTTNAHPQSGLGRADVVYIEEVEWGLTRLAAVFSSRLPSRVGPIRSARISDLELFRNYGHPAFAYSGAQKKLLPKIHRSALANIGAQVSPRGYERMGPKAAPYNLYGRPRTLLARVPRSSRVRDVGFRFGAPPKRGRHVVVATVRYPNAEVTWVWKAKLHRYWLSMDGRPATASAGGRLSASTVVIQYARHSRSRYGDKFGGRTPKIHSVGRGKAVVLRGGRAYPVRWTRRGWNRPTTFTANGKRVNFATGDVWVVLANRRHHARLR